MLVAIKDLPPEKKKEVMRLVNFYKTDGHLKQTLYYSCHQDHLLSAMKHEDYDLMYEKRSMTIPQYKYHEYVSMLGDEILGIMYFITEKRGDEIYGVEMFVWRCAEKSSYTFGKDLNAIRTMYEDSCHYCIETVVYGSTTIDYENEFGPVFLSKYQDTGIYSERMVRCRDREYRVEVSCFRRGNL